MREYLKDETILDYLLDQSDWKNLKVFLKDNKISEDLLNNVLMKVSRRHNVCAEIVMNVIWHPLIIFVHDHKTFMPFHI